MPIVGQFGSLARAGSFLLPGGAFESIATVTVGSGGASSLTFADVPGGYQHLQVRILAQETRTTSGSGALYTLMRLNSDNTAGNYASHSLDGSGSAAGASAITGTSYTAAYNPVTYFDTSASSIFGAIIVDILDYASTTKNKTIRCLGGYDANGSGTISVTSAVWLSTSAVTSVSVLPNVLVSGAAFKQYTTAALYGIKAP